MRRDEVLEKLAGRRVVASISGGKDSAALSLWLKEMEIPHDRVFLDTGWEHPLTYEYLRGPLTEALGPIEEVRGPEDMRTIILRKGMLPSRKAKWCTEQLKLLPMQAYLKARMDAGEDVVDAVGIRRGESQSRESALEWEWSSDFDCEVWRPLVEWSLADVVAIHARHGLRPNPLYLQGAERVGCWPCINTNKAELRLIADTDPARIAEVRELEARVTVVMRERYERDRAAWLAHPDPEPPAHETERHERWAAKKRRLESPFNPPAWFQSSVKNEHGIYPCVPIDKAVDWSRTSRGGRQFEMFAAAGRDAGCMRWGLCDTGAASDGSGEAA